MSFEKLQLPSFAKINWFLRVLGKRKDDYHELCTAFQTISLSDTLTFAAADTLSLTCNDPKIPTDERNLIINAAEKLRREFRITKGASVTLKKRIPSPGGLGGGSSNAAVALMGLSVLWDLPVDRERLVQIGAQIGADVPFFFTGGTAIGKGTGTEISPAPEKENKFLALIAPKVEISTAKAFEKLGSARLTKKDVKSILQICCDDAEGLESGHLEFFNDFENVVFKMEPQIGRTKEKLLDYGAAAALMTGSGASVFGIFDNDSDRQAALNSFDDGVEKFAVETISRQEYRKYLEPCRHLLFG